MADLTRWLPEAFDADALAGVPDGVLVDRPVADDDPLDALLDAYALAVAQDDAAGVRALERLWREATAGGVETREAGGSLSHLEAAIDLADAEGDAEALAELAYGWVYESWQAAKTAGRSGAKAVWTGAGKRKPIYGERARRALARTAKGPAAPEPAPDPASAAAEPEFTPEPGSLEEYYGQRRPWHRVARKIREDAEGRKLVAAFEQRTAALAPLKALSDQLEQAEETQRAAETAFAESWDKDTAAYDKANADYEAAAAKYQEAARAREAYRPAVLLALREALGVPDPHAVTATPLTAPTLGWEPIKTDPGGTQVLADAVEFAGTFAGGGGSSSLSVGVCLATAGGPCYEDKARLLCPGLSLTLPSVGADYVRRTLMESTVHELGHHLEEVVPGLKDAANEFLAYRIGKETPTPLKDVPGGEAYKDRPEVAGVKDHFDRALPDELHGYYVGRKYAGGYTEVVSMGLEQLFRDPDRFVRRDPEYFQFLITALRRGGKKWSGNS